MKRVPGVLTVDADADNTPAFVTHDAAVKDASGHCDHGRAVDRVAVDRSQCVVNPLERKWVRRRRELQVGGKLEKVVRVGTRHIGHTSNFAFAP